MGVEIKPILHTGIPSFTWVFIVSLPRAILMPRSLMKEGPTMTLLMYILIGVILVAALFFIVRGKKN
jgi:hypothetical protein